MKSLLLLLVSLLPLSSFCQKNKVLWTAAWSHDDSFIAVGGDQGNLKLFDGKTYELLKTYPVEEVILSRLKWHPTQHKLAVVTQSETFKAQILDLETDTWIPLAGIENSFRGLDWNASGEYLAVSVFEGEVCVFDQQGQQVSRFIADRKGAAGLDWHPQKDILATVGSQIGVYGFEGDTLLQFEPREKETFLLCVQWHPSGEFFATGDYGDLQEAKNKLIQFWTIDGTLQAQIEGSVGEYRNIRWSPDGERLASASDALRIWNKKGELISESHSSDDYLWGIDWNAAGDRIVTTNSSGIITIWDKDAKLIKQLDY